MGILVAILIVAALLLGFLLLTSFEAKKGKRVLSGAREALDRNAETAASYLVSTDARASLVHTIRTFLDHVVHDLVHAVLVAVRFIERTLTRITREIRGRRAKSAKDTETPVQ
jgi:hypothetical protein